jgi:hypothetical protein
VTGGYDPHEVLAAVRRLEADLEDMRAGGRPAGAELRALRETIAEDAARERAAMVEDLEVVMDVVEVGWRRVSAQIAALAGELGELRTSAEQLRRTMSGARLEIRLAPNGDPLPAAPAPAGTDAV